MQKKLLPLSRKSIVMILAFVVDPFLQKYEEFKAKYSSNESPGSTALHAQEIS